MIHLRSALRLMAMDSLFVICRLAPSMWPSSRITRSQCTCVTYDLSHGEGRFDHINRISPSILRLIRGQPSTCHAPG